MDENEEVEPTAENNEEVVTALEETENETVIDEIISTLEDAVAENDEAEGNNDESTTEPEGTITPETTEVKIANTNSTDTSEPVNNETTENEGAQEENEDF